MDETVLPPKLLTTLNSAAEVIRRHNFVHIYSHYDTDGITQATISAKALMREGIEVQVTILPTLSASQMEQITQDTQECILVTDLGALYVDKFDALPRDVIVLDHHTLGATETKRTVYANPHLYGIDGMTSGCGATMQFLFQITLNKINWDLAPLAITGMVGDRQDLGGLKALNDYVLQGASSRGLVTQISGSLIPFGDLSTEFYSNTDPYLVGITGDQDGTAAFLKEAKIPAGATFLKLNEEQRNKLSSMIALKLVSQGVTLDKIQEIVRPRFFFPKYNTDASSMSQILNQQGRSETPSVAIGTAMGDSKCLEEAKRIDTESRTEMLQGVTQAVKTLKQLKNIQWFDSSEFGFTGIVCGVIMSYIGNPNYPTIGVNLSESLANTSSRATFPLLEKGIDLQTAMKKACAEAGGEGGGHKIAAGGAFPSENLETFLNQIDRIIGEQKASRF